MCGCVCVCACAVSCLILMLAKRAFRSSHDLLGGSVCGGGEPPLCLPQISAQRPRGRVREGRGRGWAYTYL